MAKQSTRPEIVALPESGNPEIDQAWGEIVALLHLALRSVDQPQALYEALHKITGRAEPNNVERAYLQAVLREGEMR